MTRFFLLSLLLFAVAEVSQAVEGGYSMNNQWRCQNLGVGSDCLPAVGSIKTNDAEATGFVVDVCGNQPNGNVIYAIATAKHVLEDTPSASRKFETWFAYLGALSYSKAIPAYEASLNIGDDGITVQLFEEYQNSSNEIVYPMAVARGNWPDSWWYVSRCAGADGRQLPEKCEQRGVIGLGDPRPGIKDLAIVQWTGVFVDNVYKDQDAAFFFDGNSGSIRSGDSGAPITIASLGPVGTSSTAIGMLITRSPENQGSGSAFGIAFDTKVPWNRNMTVADWILATSSVLCDAVHW